MRGEVKGKVVMGGRECRPKGGRVECGGKRYFFREGDWVRSRESESGRGGRIELKSLKEKAIASQIYLEGPYSTLLHKTA